MYRKLLAVLALMGAAHSAAVAQTCSGLASYSRGPIQVAGHGSIVPGQDIHQVGASLGYGRAGSVFGDINIASTDGPDSYLSYGVDLGYAVATLGLVQVCPVAALAIDDLPDYSGSKATGRTATFGLAMGAAVGTSWLQIVPSGGLSLQYVRRTYEDNLGNSGTQSDAYGVANLAVGLVSNSLSIRPELAIPLGLTGANPAVGLTVGYNFGSGRR